jgi:hypothetical protein
MCRQGTRHLQGRGVSVTSLTTATLHTDDEARTRVQPTPLRDLFPMQALTNGVWLGLVTSFVLVTWVLLDRGGWDYYTTPLELRYKLETHRTLRPSAPIAHLMGTAGWLMMFMPVVYAARKRARWLQRFGSMPAWLEAHIFCGIVGPVLVTLHTSFKFNGLVSVAYWAMVAVALSGFLGRHLYVQIPKNLRGAELTRKEVETRIEARRTALLEDPLPPAAHDAIVALVPDGAAPPGGRPAWRHVRGSLVAAGVPGAHAREIVKLARERDGLMRRLDRLDRTRKLFALWHVFHMPLVWLMFAIVTLHIGLALYLGYWPLA